MATKKTMVFYGNTKKTNNVDKNEPGKNPKPKPKENPKPPSTPATPANKKAATDMTKKANAQAGGPGQILARPGQSKSTTGGDMRQAQIDAAKAKAEKYKKKYGVYPTPANVKKYGKS
jgi:hypothetical protein